MCEIVAFFCNCCDRTRVESAEYERFEIPEETKNGHTQSMLAVWGLILNGFPQKKLENSPKYQEK